MTVYISRRANLKFNIKAHYETVYRFMIYLIALLSAAALILFAVCMILGSQFKRVNIEAGEYFSAQDIFGEGARFSEDFDMECINRTGVYYFTVNTPKGERKVRLSVKDTKAPQITTKDVYFAVGGEFPQPEEFIDTVYEPSEFFGEYLNDLPKLTNPGEHEMKIRFTDSSGNKTEIFNVKMIQIYDNEPPKIDVSPLIVCEAGGSIEYKPYVTLSDNCTGELSFEVDESQLILSEVGEYPVYVTARDGVGNRSKKVKITVKIIDTYSDDELNRLLDEIVEDMNIEDKSREEICREIYKQVRSRLIYTGGSVKGNVKRAAYQALVGQGGDCYSYFSLAKLLLDRCGIENLDIQRLPGQTADTHFWSLVNIGDPEAPKWYHFDTTELRADRYDHSGCLLTEKQINAYNKARMGFYLYDRDLYPKVSDEIITPTPRLEELY